MDAKVTSDLRDRLTGLDHHLHSLSPELRAELATLLGQETDPFQPKATVQDHWYTPLAEATVSLESPARAHRTAELRVRRRSQYVDRWVLVLLALSPVVGVALFVSRFGGTYFDWPMSLALLLIIGCVLATIEVGLRRVVGRPRPAGDADTVAACDAIAASAAQRLVSTGGCLAFLALAWEALSTVDDSNLAAAIHWWVSVFALALALAFLAQRSRIERPSPAKAVA
jgi:hypothetical protein